MAKRGKSRAVRFSGIPARVKTRIKKTKPRRTIHSSHKVRSELFRDSTTYPFRRPSTDKVARER